MASGNWILFVLAMLGLAIRAFSESGDTVTTTTVDARSGGDEIGSSASDGLFAKAVWNSGCVSNPCKNEGVCLDSGSSYVCQCPSPFYGTDCRMHAQVHRAGDRCYPNPCLHDGVCTVSGSSFRPTCLCTSPFDGDRCEKVVQIADPCLGTNPCSNGCSCVASCRHSSGYYCRSKTGYLGKNCTVPPPVIRCDPNQVVVTVDDSFLREYDLGIGSSRLHLAQAAQDFAAEDCFASTINGIAHNFMVPLPFTKCGTTAEEKGGKTVVTNIIWLNRATAGGYDMPVPVIRFQCIYSKEYVIVTSLRPAVDQPQIISNTGIVRVHGVIELCKVPSSCPLSCPSVYAVSRGATYTVGEMIHLNIGGDRSHELTLGINSLGIISLKKLHLSCDREPGSAPVVRLVTNGCPVGSFNHMPTMVTHSGRSASICASFQVPRLHGCTVFYIHAEIETCGSSGCTFSPASCSNRLFGGRRRRALSPDSNYTKVLYNSGPIVVIEGSPGLPREFLFPNTSTVHSLALIDDITNVSDNGPGYGYGYVVGLSALCLLVILATASVIAGICFRESLFSAKESCSVDFNS